jgi:AcrR family transcriptional regulator
MKRAGLTYGDLYAHFESGDDLVAHAIDRMFQHNALMLARHLERDDVEALPTIIDDYLSKKRIAVNGRGRPFPPLLDEAPRMPTLARGLPGRRNIQGAAVGCEGPWQASLPCLRPPTNVPASCVPRLLSPTSRWCR